MISRSRRAIAWSFVVAAAAVGWSSSLSAQQPTQRRPEARTQQSRQQETIEIRGQVPTPQVVTIRPREAPVYNRRVLVPTFLDHDFWPSILPPIQLVAPPPALRADSAGRAPADSTVRQPTPARPPPGTPPARPR